MKWEPKNRNKHKIRYRTKETVIRQNLSLIFIKAPIPYIGQNKNINDKSKTVHNLGVKSTLKCVCAKVCAKMGRMCI